MKKKVKKILENILQKIDCQEENNLIEKKLKVILEKIRKKIASKKINAEIFVGGSFAKSTAIRKKLHDVDVFIRFSEKYPEGEFQKLLKTILSDFEYAKLVHGSRDYYQMKVDNLFFVEIVPVLKIKSVKQARNITDFSYFHVKYINKKIKSKKTLDEIKLAKSFCEAKRVYGAESYIRGFSGYSLELLIIYYKTFLNFLKKLSKPVSDKIIIDIEKHYKNKSQILMDLNESKLGSPIILVDPTHKHRNALAALSTETFEKFQEEARKFLKYPSEKGFEPRTIKLDKIKSSAETKGQEFALIEIKTSKQEGDIAGSKLLKFFNYLNCKISKYFEIKEKNFEYNGDNSAKGIFVAKSKEKILISGPYLNDEKNVKKFKENHKNIYIKKNRVYCEEKINFNLKEFLNNLKKKEKKIIKEMGISGIEVN